MILIITPTRILVILAKDVAPHSGARADAKLERLLDLDAQMLERDPQLVRCFQGQLAIGRHATCQNLGETWLPRLAMIEPPILEHRRHLVAARVVAVLEVLVEQLADDLDIAPDLLARIRALARFGHRADIKGAARVIP